MAKESSPENRLLQLRDRLVKRRREIVELALDTTIPPEEGGRALQEIQEQIEALDRAAKDENLLGPSIYESRGLLGS